MNLLFVFDRYEIGGIVSFLDSLTQVLVGKNNQIGLLGGQEPGKFFPPQEYFKDEGSTKNIFFIKGNSRVKKDLSLLFSPIKVFNFLIKKVKPDLIVFNNCASALGIILSSSWGIPKAYNFHGAWDIEEKNAAREVDSITKKIKLALRLVLYFLVENLVLALCQKIIVLSPESKKLLGRYLFVDPKKVVVLAPGINTNFFSPKDHSFRKKTKIFSLSRLDPKKGLPLLLNTLKVLKDQKVDFQASIGGLVDREKRKSIKEFCLKRGLPVKILGYLDKEQKRKLYQESDLFIVSSIGFEAYPTVIMEALACGTPTIATALGGIPEMMAGLGEEFLCEELQPESLAEKVSQFCQQEQAVKKAISKKCRDLALKKWDISQRGMIFLKTYRSLLKGGHPSS